MIFDGGSTDYTIFDYYGGECEIEDGDGNVNTQSNIEIVQFDDLDITA